MITIHDNRGAETEQQGKLEPTGSGKSEEQ